METVATLLANYCFPIVCCIGLGWFVFKMSTDHKTEISELNEEHRKQITELNAQHKAETNKMTEALNNNTLVLQKVSDKLDIILLGGNKNE